MKNKQEKINFIHSLKSESEIHLLLDELLPEIGFKDVKITHEDGNRPEYGKDLICSLLDALENKKDWIAFVVKKGVVSGSSGVVADIEDQVQECFEYPFESLEQKGKISINKVKVVTNFHFSSGAKDKIQRKNVDQRANIDFWDAEKLVILIDTYYPRFWVRGSKQYKKYVDRLFDRIKFDNVLKTITADDKKIEKLLENVISPKMSERVTNLDGSIKWTPRESSTIINIPDNSIIIGEPGSGKTTLFKNLANDIIAQNSIRNDVEFYPIILTFKEIKSTGFNIVNAVKFYFDKEWLIDLKIDYNEILQKNACVIFIDALDEIALKEDKEKALLAVGEFNNQFSGIKVICSSRPSDYVFQNCEQSGFRYLELADLNITQVEAFLNAYFGENLVKSKTLLKSLKDSEILEKLPKTPMTITLITMLFDEREVEIPATISDLYENFVNLLLGKITAQDTFELLEIGAKHRILCEIAKTFHIDLKRSKTKSEVVKIILDYSSVRGHNFNGEDLLNDLVENTGLLFVNDKNEIEFKHQSFQEYFTAYEIFHHRQSDRNYFVENFNDVWWQNVAIFFAGMSKDAPGLLEEIIEKSVPKTLQEYIANIGGMGKILQALYNTPIDARKKGIERGLLSTNNAINYIVNEENTETKFWRNFSRYGLLQIYGGWFNYSNWSVTLVKPLQEYFDETIQKLETVEDNEGNLIDLEVGLFLVSSILASDDFLDFTKLKQLIEKSKLSDLDLVASIDTHYTKLMRHISKSYKSNQDIQYIHKKIERRIRSIENFTEIVNERLNQKKLS